jgi:phenylalanyl-tRNA synthetase alpha chain
MESHLHPNEKRILKALAENPEDTWYDPSGLESASNLKADAISRAVSWLTTKGLVEVSGKVKQEISLDKEGVEYLKKGFPERRLMQKIGKGSPIEELKKKEDPQVFNIGFGWLRKKNLVEVRDGFVKVKTNSETEDERILQKLGSGKLLLDGLSEGERKAVEMLKSRQNVIKVSEEKLFRFKITKEGRKIAQTLEEDESVSQLTPELITSGAWEGRKFRPYDVSVYVKPTYLAKKHPLQVEIQRVRDIFQLMGFSEIKGGFVESAFWNFDALFTPQDHPARDMQDTFYLKSPREIEIPDYEKFRKNVSATHENGWTTGSTGWGYKWDGDLPKKALLRTHTTVVTGRYLSMISEKDLPVKVFSIGKVFRNEALDYKHLPEFYQVEGIVVDKNASFRHLLGILKEFYDQMGFKKIRFRPSYFPYTEMSVEPEVFFEEKEEWIELGGAGIFRPEVVKPLLGFECPVLAWGLGVDRVVALKLGLNDIRNLYLSDLEWLRKTKWQ